MTTPTGGNFKLQFYLRHKYYKLFTADCEAHKKADKRSLEYTRSKAERARQIIKMTLNRVK